MRFKKLMFCLAAMFMYIPAMIAQTIPPVTAVPAQGKVESLGTVSISWEGLEVFAESTVTATVTKDGQPYSTPQLTKGEFGDYNYYNSYNIPVNATEDGTYVITVPAGELSLYPFSQGIWDQSYPSPEVTLTYIIGDGGSTQPEVTGVTFNFEGEYSQALLFESDESVVDPQWYVPTTTSEFWEAQSIPFSVMIASQPGYNITVTCETEGLTNSADGGDYSLQALTAGGGGGGGIFSLQPTTDPGQYGGGYMLDIMSEKANNAVFKVIIEEIEVDEAEGVTLQFKDVDFSAEIEEVSVINTTGGGRTQLSYGSLQGYFLPFEDTASLIYTVNEDDYFLTFEIDGLTQGSDYTVTRSQGLLGLNWTVNLTSAAKGKTLVATLVKGEDPEAPDQPGDEPEVVYVARGNNGYSLGTGQNPSDYYLTKQANGTYVGTFPVGDGQMPYFGFYSLGEAFYGPNSGYNSAFGVELNFANSNEATTSDVGTLSLYDYQGWTVVGYPAGVTGGNLTATLDIAAGTVAFEFAAESTGGEDESDVVYVARGNNGYSLGTGQNPSDYYLTKQANGTYVGTFPVGDGQMPYFGFYSLGEAFYGPNSGYNSAFGVELNFANSNEATTSDVGTLSLYDYQGWTVVGYPAGVTGGNLTATLDIAAGTVAFVFAAEGTGGEEEPESEVVYVARGNNGYSLGTGQNPSDYYLTKQANGTYVGTFPVGDDQMPYFGFYSLGEAFYGPNSGYNSAFGVELNFTNSNEATTSDVGTLSLYDYQGWTVVGYPAGVTGGNLTATLDIAAGTVAFVFASDSSEVPDVELPNVQITRPAPGQEFESLPGIAFVWGDYSALEWVNPSATHEITYTVPGSNAIYSVAVTLTETGPGDSTFDYDATLETRPGRFVCPDNGGIWMKAGTYAFTIPAGLVYVTVDGVKAPNKEVVMYYNLAGLPGGQFTETAAVMKPVYQTEATAITTETLDNLQLRFPTSSKDAWEYSPNDLSYVEGDNVPATIQYENEQPVEIFGQIELPNLVNFDLSQFGNKPGTYVFNIAAGVVEDAAAPNMDPSVNRAQTITITVTGELEKNTINVVTNVDSKVLELYPDFLTEVDAKLVGGEYDDNMGMYAWVAGVKATSQQNTYEPAGYPNSIGIYFEGSEFAETLDVKVDSDAPAGSYTIEKVIGIPDHTTWPIWTVTLQEEANDATFTFTVTTVGEEEPEPEVPEGPEVLYVVRSTSGWANTLQTEETLELQSDGTYVGTFSIPGDYWFDYYGIQTLRNCVSFYDPETKTYYGAPFSVFAESQRVNFEFTNGVMETGLASTTKSDDKYVWAYPVNGAPGNVTATLDLTNMTAKFVFSNDAGDDIYYVVKGTNLIGPNDITMTEEDGVYVAYITAVRSTSNFYIQKMEGSETTNYKGQQYENGITAAGSYPASTDEYASNWMFPQWVNTQANGGSVVRLEFDPEAMTLNATMASLLGEYEATPANGSIVTVMTKAEILWNGIDFVLPDMTDNIRNELDKSYVKVTVDGEVYGGAKLYAQNVYAPAEGSSPEVDGATIVVDLGDAGLNVKGGVQIEIYAGAVRTPSGEVNGPIQLNYTAVTAATNVTFDPASDGVLESADAIITATWSEGNVESINELVKAVVQKIEVSNEDTNGDIEEEIPANEFLTIEDGKLKIDFTSLPAGKYNFTLPEGIVNIAGGYVNGEVSYNFVIAAPESSITLSFTAPEGFDIKSDVSLGTEQPLRVMNANTGTQVIITNDSEKVTFNQYPTTLQFWTSELYTVDITTNSDAALYSFTASTFDDSFGLNRALLVLKDGIDGAQFNVTIKEASEEIPTELVLPIDEQFEATPGQEYFYTPDANGKLTITYDELGEDADPDNDFYVLNNGAWEPVMWTNEPYVGPDFQGSYAYDVVAGNQYKFAPRDAGKYTATFEEKAAVGETVEFMLAIESNALSDDPDVFTPVEPGFRTIEISANGTIVEGEPDEYGNFPANTITIQDMDGTQWGGVESYSNGILKLWDPFEYVGNYKIVVPEAVFMIDGNPSAGMTFYFTTGEAETVETELYVVGAFNEYAQPGEGEWQLEETGEDTGVYTGTFNVPAGEFEFNLKSNEGVTFVFEGDGVAPEGTGSTGEEERPGVMIMPVTFTNGVYNGEMKMALGGEEGFYWANTTWNGGDITITADIRNNTIKIEAEESSTPAINVVTFNFDGVNNAEQFVEFRDLSDVETLDPLVAITSNPFEWNYEDQFGITLNAVSGYVIQSIECENGGNGFQILPPANGGDDVDDMTPAVWMIMGGSSANGSIFNVVVAAEQVEPAPGLQVALNFGNLSSEALDEITITNEDGQPVAITGNTVMLPVNGKQVVYQILIPNVDENEPSVVAPEGSNYPEDSWWTMIYPIDITGADQEVTHFQIDLTLTELLPEDAVLDVITSGLEYDEGVQINLVLDAPEGFNANEQTHIYYYALDELLEWKLNEEGQTVMNLTFEQLQGKLMFRVDEGYELELVAPADLSKDAYSISSEMYNPDANAEDEDGNVVGGGEELLYTVLNFNEAISGATFQVVVTKAPEINFPEARIIAPVDGTEAVYQVIVMWGDIYNVVTAGTMQGTITTPSGESKTYTGNLASEDPEDKVIVDHYNSLQFRKLNEVGDPFEGGTSGYKEPGIYTVTIPAGSVYVNGQPNPEAVLHFTVGSADMGYADADPEDGSVVASLSQVVLTWGEGAMKEKITANSDMTVDVLVNGVVKGQAEVIIIEDLGQIGYTAVQAEEYGQAAVVLLDEVISFETTGKVSFTIPEGMVKNDAGKVNLGQTFSYTVLEANNSDEWTPAPYDEDMNISKVANTETITITWNGALTANPNAESTVIAKAENGKEVYFFEGEGLTINGNSIILDLEEIEDAGIYTFNVPAGFVYVGGNTAINGETMNTYEITVGGGETPEPVYLPDGVAYPADGSVLDGGLGNVEIRWDGVELDVTGGEDGRIYMDPSLIKVYVDGKEMHFPTEGMGAASLWAGTVYGTNEQDGGEDVFEVTKLNFNAGDMAFWWRGEIQIVIPEGLVKDVTGAINPEIVLTYYAYDQATMITWEPAPEVEGARVEFEYGEGIIYASWKEGAVTGLVKDPEFPIFVQTINSEGDAGGHVNITEFISVEDGKLKIDVTTFALGQYDLTLPGSTVLIEGGYVNGESYYNFAIVTEPVPTKITPEITIEDDQYIVISWDDNQVTVTDEFTLTLTDSEGNTTTVDPNDGAVFVDEQGNLVIDFDALGLEEGDYTLTLAEGSVNIDENGMPTYNNEVVYEFSYEEGKVVGVDSVAGETEFYRVYNLNGVNVLNTEDKNDLKLLENGIYIVNGRKVMLRN